KVAAEQTSRPSPTSTPSKSTPRRSPPLAPSSTERTPTGPSTPGREPDSTPRNTPPSQPAPTTTSPWSADQPSSGVYSAVEQELDREWLETNALAPANLPDASTWRAAD